MYMYLVIFTVYSLYVMKNRSAWCSEGAAGCICPRAPGFGGTKMKDNIFTKFELLVIFTKL